MSRRDGPARRRRVWVILAGAVVLAMVLAAVVIGSRLRSPEQVAADAAPPPPSNVTVAVERRVLSEELLVQARIIAGGSVPVRPPGGLVGDAAVITGVPVDVGSVVDEGEVVLEVAGEPVVALQLAFPLYRDLFEGTRGPDVEQVQRALRRLGYRLPADGVLGVSTRHAIQRWLDDRGYEPGSTAAGPAPAGEPGPEVVGPEVVGDAGTPTTPSTESAQVVLRRSQVVVIDRAGRRVTSVGTRVGDTLSDPAAALLELDGEPNMVRAVLPADVAGGLATDQQAELIDDVAGTVVPLVVGAVGGLVTDDSTGATGTEVMFRFTGEPLPLVDRSQRVRVPDTAAAVGEVLAVPVSALYSRPDGASFVTVEGADGLLRDVDVWTGRTAGGWVEITDGPADLPPGTLVVVGAALAPGGGG